MYNYCHRLLIKMTSKLSYKSQCMKTLKTSRHSIFDEKCVFSIKSAYHVVWDCQSRDSALGIASTSNGDTNDGSLDWKKLWWLPLPHNLRHFLWRATSNSLLLIMMIKHRGMKFDTGCPFCFRFNEAGSHSSYKCRFVVAIFPMKEIYLISKRYQLYEELRTHFWKTGD